MAIGRKTAIFLQAAVAVFLLFASLGVFYMARSAPPRLYSDPAAVRPRGKAEWDKLMNPPPPVVETATSATLDSGLAGDAQSAALEAVAQSAASARREPFYIVQEMEPGETLDFDGSKLRIRAIGTAYLEKPFQEEIEAPFCFFGPDLKPLSPAEMEELNKIPVRPATFLEYDCPYAPARLSVVLEGAEDFQLMGMRLFDARTFEWLGGGSGYAFEDLIERDQYAIGAWIWHNAPVNLVLDLACPPVKVFDFEPRPGEAFREGEFSCKLAGIIEKTEAGYNRSGDVSGFARFYPNRHATEGEKAFFSFSFHPPSYFTPLRLTFLDKEGGELPSRIFWSSDSQMVLIVNGQTKEICRIRASYLPNRRRIVVRLPGLPGMPKENQNVTNLFDVRVPYLRVYAPYMDHFLAPVLQLDYPERIGKWPSSGPPLDDVFPEFRNATVREIAEFYERQEGGRLSVDQAKQGLVLKYRKPWKEIARDFLIKIKVLKPTKAP